MIDNRVTELDGRREAKTLLEEFLCGYQNILLSRGINANEAVCKQNELIDEYAERIDHTIAAKHRMNCGWEGGEAMTDTLRFYGEINLQKIVDEQARKLQRNVDEATLDKAADTLAKFGYVKVDAELGRGTMISETESLLWELVGALDVADATEADKKPIIAEYARRIPATLGRGTCRNQWQWNSGFCCSECFYTVPFVGKFAGKPFVYCPNCGNEVER